MAKTQFSSKIGLIAATVGSAVGLGNIWRFPAEAQACGGAAFLLVYIACVIILGIPVMLAEFSLGRAGGTDAIGAFGAVDAKRKNWAVVGAISVLTAFLISIFYMVVTGWTIDYLVNSITGELYESENGLQPGSGLFQLKMQQNIEWGVKPLIYTLVVVLINMVILLAGVTKGIERISNILMPMLFVLLLAFCIVSVTLPNAGAGLNFFFHPDFSKITGTVFLKALGQAFFSLSLGMGILITYASYYPPTTSLINTSVTVSLMDMLVAVMMGIIIFPAITAFGLQNHGVEGTTLVFVTLPEVFVHLPLTRLWSSLFFLLLCIAALTSTVSISEVTVKCLQDRMNLSRKKAVLCVMLPLIFLSGICSLSMGPLDHLRLLDRNMFNFLDYVTADFMLPVAAIGVCLFVGWFAPKNMLKEQLTNNGTLKGNLYKPILFIIRYIAPVLILLVLISTFL